MKIGDRVAYSEAFLQCIGGHEIGHTRGVIKFLQVTAYGTVADINWSDGTQGRVLTSNLQPMKRSK
jgi:hypothetical protein